MRPGIDYWIRFILASVALGAFYASCADEREPMAQEDIIEDVQAIPSFGDSRVEDVAVPGGDVDDADTQRDTGRDGDVERGPGAFGDSCVDDIDCDSMLCVVMAPDVETGLCSESCLEHADCDEASDCIFVPIAGSDGERACIPRDYCLDADGDGYGAGPGCAGPDCDDTNPDIHPGATEVCDGVDNTCDGRVDELVAGAGADCTTELPGICAPGRMVCTDAHMTCVSIEVPRDEVCNGLDDDCDGVIDEGAIDAPTWYRDADGDRFGDPDDFVVSCTRPEGYVDEAGDCDDSDPLVNPVAREVCDGIDNNCNGVVDEGFEDDGVASCDDDPSTGCETDIISSRDHCGACGRACPDDSACVNGDCTCPAGEVFCDGACVPRNWCGGCSVLEGEPGDDCSACGVWACDGAESLVCEGPDVNACGGCASLASEPGDDCGTCGTQVCDGIDALRCEDRPRNVCGGCAVLDPAPGSSCGECGDYACDGEDGVRCDGPGVNECGGCGPLDLELETSCGYCGTGLAQCVGPTATCVGETSRESDDLNCGTCDVVCADGRSCVSAVCTCPADIVVFDSQPDAVELCQGEEASFRVQVEGDVVGYRWEASVNGGLSWDALLDSVLYSGTATNTLLVQNVTSEVDGTLYRVRVTTPCSTVTSDAASLRVLTPPTSVSASASPNPLCVGSTLNLTATGGSGATSWSWSGPDGFTAITQNATRASVNAFHGGVYSVIASNSCGSQSATTPSVTVRIATTIATHPASATVCTGGPAVFSVGATGSSLSYRWQVNHQGGNPSAWNDTTDGYPHAGSATSTLTVTPNGSHSGYIYRAIVTGACGAPRTSNHATLTVTPNTAITSHPSNRNVGAGSTTTFSVNATGGGLTYLWQESTDGGATWNGLLSGGVYSGTGTPTLTITNVPSTFHGRRFRARVAGACGATVFSNSALLQVLTPTNSCGGTSSLPSEPGDECGECGHYDCTGPNSVACFGETDTSSDPLNCGFCGNNCGPNFHCLGGACVCGTELCLPSATCCDCAPFPGSPQPFRCAGEFQSCNSACQGFVEEQRE